MKKLLLVFLLLSCFSSVVFGAASNYAGVYRGTITGDDYGPWMGVVEATGRTKMLFYSNIYRTMDGSQGYYVNSFGNLSAVSLSNRAAFSVSFTTGGSVYGTWASPSYASGKISGSRQVNNSKYAGTYSGTISGGDSGSWTIGINGAGLISGSGYSKNVGSFIVDGAVDDSGFFMGATDQSAAFGSISGNNIAGSWFDNGVIYGGTFNGIKQTSGTCTYSIFPSSGSFPPSGGTTTVSVTTSSPNCSWTTSNPLFWVNLSPVTGNGSQSITVSINANSGAFRSGSITIAGNTYAITQQAGVSQEITAVLTNESPDYAIHAGTNATVYGTALSNRITLESGARAELINFPGNNLIEFESDVTWFTVSRSGTVVTFQGFDGTLLKIPATIDDQTLVFDGTSPLVLRIHENQVMLNDQVIDSKPVKISSGNIVA